MDAGVVVRLVDNDNYWLVAFRGHPGGEVFSMPKIKTFYVEQRERQPNREMGRAKGYGPKGGLRGDNLLYDSFADADGKPLTSHRTRNGRNWKAYGGGLACSGCN